MHKSNRQNLGRPISTALSLVRSVALNTLLLLGVFLMMDFFTGSIAHARRGFPLFIVISNNPVILAIGAVLVAIWFFARRD